MPAPLRYRLRADGREVAVEGDRLVDARAPFALTLDLGAGELRAGLINAHDHLHRNHYPRIGSPPYPDAYAWGRDLHERWADTIARARALDRRDALLFGALKNLISGVTTVVHHDRWEPAFADAFPIRVAAVRTVHSLGIEPALAAQPPGDPEAPLCIHLAEGTTAAMAEEVREAERLGLLNDRLLAVHAVGVDAAGADVLVGHGVAVVWCPTSNAFLYGRTAPHGLLARAAVLLGTDSLLSGAGTLLDELAAARATGPLSDERLLLAVGALAAERLGAPMPVLAAGAPADLVFLRRPVLEATCEDVLLVVVAGVPRLADARFAELFELAGVGTEALRVGGTDKLVAAPLGSVVARVVAEWEEAGRILEPRRAQPASGGAYATPSA